MPNQPVLVIALDGYEPSLAVEMAGQGLLPAFQALRERGAYFDLDHGEAKRTGLAAEHFATGLDPERAARWSAVNFDAASYGVSQRPTATAPFPAGLAARTVVFDAAYFDLERAPSVRGVVNWGAHDPGVAAGARPASLHQEMLARFGPYPAAEWLYGFVWQSPEKTAAMGQGLARAVDVRAEAAAWLLKERLPDWDLGLVMVSESHSAIEALWHGIDPRHPLHHLASAPVAGQGVRAVYQAIDRLIGKLTQACPQAAVVLFSMHGMGSNDSDVAGMVLLPELLYRRAFGRPYMRPRDWESTVDGVPLLAEDADWHDEMRRLIPDPRSRPARAFDRLRGRAGDSIDWMPAARYRPFWPRMPAFALPSFYDGQIRLNLKGREAKGMIPLDSYRAAMEGIEAMLHACRDTVTGQPVVASIQRSPHADPRDLSPSQADLIVIWRGAPLGFDHPELGRIGPTPYRRTGGHTGPRGMALIAGEGFTPGQYAPRSAFDMAPTLIDLLGETPGPDVSGVSALADLAARRQPRA